MNIVPYLTLPNKITVYKALYQRKPVIQYLKPFGNLVYVHILIEARQPGTKLMHRAKTSIFVGYRKSSKIRRVFILDRNVIVESRDVTFKPYQVTVPIPALDFVTKQGTNVQTLIPKASSSTAESRSSSIPLETKSTTNQPRHSGPGERLDSPSRILIASPLIKRRRPPPNPPSNTTPKPPVTTKSGRTVRPTERSKHSVNTAIDIEKEDIEEEEIDAYTHVAQDFADHIPTTIR